MCSIVGIKICKDNNICNITLPYDNGNITFNKDPLRIIHNITRVGWPFSYSMYIFEVDHPNKIAEKLVPNSSAKGNVILIKTYNDTYVNAYIVDIRQLLEPAVEPKTFVRFWCSPKTFGLTRLGEINYGFKYSTSDDVWNI